MFVQYNVTTQGVVSASDALSNASLTDVFNGAQMIDPGLGALADNGGYTKTHAPAFDSAVVDAASEGFRADSMDQRGVSGNFNTNADIGSVEYNGNRPPALMQNLSGKLTGVVGDTVDPVLVADYFTDPDGDTVSTVSVTGLPAGLTFDGDYVSGTLEAAGTYFVTVVVTDDATTPLQKVLQFKAKVTTAAEAASAAAASGSSDSGSSGGGSLSMLWLGLLGLAGLRRRR